MNHIIDGRTWRPFSVIWDSPDGQFSTTIYALSRDHARLLLDSIKETGRIDGEIVMEINT